MLRRPLLATPMALLLALTACPAGGTRDAPPDSIPDSATAAAAGAGVAAVLTLDTASVAPGDPIPVTLRVVNGTTDPLTLEFTSSQRYDLQLASPDGETLWTWSMDKLFAQMMGQEMIAAGDTIEFSDTVPAPEMPGDYRLIGTITTSTRDLADTAAVTVGR